MIDDITVPIFVRDTYQYILRNVLNGLRLVWSENSTKFALIILLLLSTVALLGPAITPYRYDETIYNDNGAILQTASPSVEHPLGTTYRGYDVLSRLIYGARPTMIAGLLGGLFIIIVGIAVGLVSGYMGGWTDDILMRITDVVYSIPLLPFSIVIVASLGVNFLTSILVIGLLLWRSSARVIRSQVLQIKNREFVLVAKASGASRLRIILKHILPNVVPMGMLFFALGIGYTIILQASLAFVGVSDPFVPSWGVMLRNVNNVGMISSAWWWSLPPGILISLTVISTYTFSRGYEAAIDQNERNITVNEG